MLNNDLGLLARKQQRVSELEAALTRTQEDINWMLNSQKFLNPSVFDYIEETLKNKE